MAHSGAASRSAMRGAVAADCNPTLIRLTLVRAPAGVVGLGLGCLEVVGALRGRSSKARMRSRLSLLIGRPGVWIISGHRRCW